MNSVKSVKSVLIAAAFGLSAASPVSALVLSADYSDPSVSGGIFQTAGGQLQSGPGGGAADITAIFKADVTAAFTYLQNSIKVAFNHVVTFKLRDFGMSGADGDSQITSEDVNLRPDSSIIRLDSGTVSHFFADPTPFDNSEYMMNFTDAVLGGGTINVGRYGTAVSGGAADMRTDILTLILHETEHSIGYSDGATRFEALVGPSTGAGGPDRSLVVPTTLTGLPSAFIIPFLSSAAHIDPFTQNAVYQHTVVSEPSFGDGDRWLTTGAEFYGLCTILGCTRDEVNANLIGTTAIPEPNTILLTAIAGLGLIGTARRRNRPSV